VAHKIAIGVIGMGWMGHVHSRSYLQIPLRFPESDIEPRLVICGDDNERLAQQSRATLGFGEATTDWRQVVDHPEVQAVTIAAPNHLHLEIVRAAVEARKHVFCEKPVGRSPEETAEIESLVRKAGVLSGVGYNYRWAPMVLHARQLIRSGKLGELTNYRGRFFAMYGSHPSSQLSWRFDSNLAGYGVLSDLVSHSIDLAQYLAAPITRVVSNRHTFIEERPLPIPGRGTHFSLGKPDDPTGKVTNEDYMGALVEFGNGVRGTIEASRTIFGPKCENAFEVNGTEGALGWNYERLNELQLYLPGEDGLHDGYTRLLAGDKYPYHGNFNPGDGNCIGYEELKVIEAFEFLQSLTKGDQGQPGFSEALAVAEVQAAMFRSWETGRWEDVQSLRIE
jgi:predicted dehydrogenase